MSRDRDHFEPWDAAPSRSWEASFRTPPAVDDPEQVDRWRAARDRAEGQAEWIIWGSNMVPPTAAASLLGRVEVMDDRHIIAAIRPPTTDRDDAPDQATLARRICACVNACTGMIDPPRAIEEARALLVDLAAGRVGGTDDRVVSCLARLGPGVTHQRLEGQRVVPCLPGTSSGRPSRVAPG